MATLHRLAAMGVAIVLAGSLGGCPKPPAPSGATLEGTWTGNITYLAGLKLDSNSPTGTPFDKPLTVTFDAQGQPDHVDLSVGNADEVLLLATDKLVNVGDTDTQSFTKQNSGGGTTNTNVTATVTAVSRSDTVYSLSLDLTVEIVGSGTLAGPHTLVATILSDGSLDWNGTSDLKINFGQASLSLVVTMTGTLAKQ